MEAAQCCVDRIKEIVAFRIAFTSYKKYESDIYSRGFRMNKIRALHCLEWISFCIFTFFILLNFFSTFTVFSATNTGQTFWHYFCVSPYYPTSLHVTHRHRSEGPRGDTNH